MSISQRLDLRQGQSLIMTPQLQQAIKLLQLSNLEVSAFVEAELERNPMLETGDPDEDRRRDPGEEGQSADAQANASDDQSAPQDSLELASAETLPTETDTPLDTSYDDVWDEDRTTAPMSQVDTAGGQMEIGSRGGAMDFSDPDLSLEATLSETKTLREHLLEQLHIELQDPAERTIGHHLIDLVDEAGWLNGNLEQVADLLGCEMDRLRSVLARMQRFEPSGIMACSLAECLAQQLRDKDRLDPAMQALLDNLDLLAKREIDTLMRICGVDGEDLRDMVAEIRALDPKPGLAFSHEISQPVTPDILMRPGPDGSWIVELNPETLPKVLVNTEYFARITRDARSKSERDYITEQMQSANWLVKSLHQRATTILKVASEIVRQQDAFFARGVEHLRPLVLRDIAEAIEMHESTVSRVTTNKFIATPRGLYELKFFFTAAIASSTGGEAHSAEAVRHRIKSLIDQEEPKAILSDDRIVEILKSDGIDIARRTVAKYRESMKIPSSVQRRRQKTRPI